MKNQYKSMEINEFQWKINKNQWMNSSPSSLYKKGEEFRGLWWLNPKRLKIGWLLAFRPRVGSLVLKPSASTPLSYFL